MVELILVLATVIGVYAENKAVYDVAKSGEGLKVVASDMSAIKKQFADGWNLRPCVGANQKDCSNPDRVTGQ